MIRVQENVPLVINVSTSTQIKMEGQYIPIIKEV